RPRATMYLWVPVPGGRGSEEFARRARLEEGVVIMPGAALGAGGEGFLRLALTQGPERLREAATRLGRLLCAGTGFPAVVYNPGDELARPEALAGAQRATRPAARTGSAANIAATPIAAEGARRGACGFARPPRPGRPGLPLRLHGRGAATAGRARISHAPHGVSRPAGLRRPGRGRGDGAAGGAGRAGPARGAVARPAHPLGSGGGAGRGCRSRAGGPHAEPRRAAPST